MALRHTARLKHLTFGRVRYSSVIPRLRFSVPQTGQCLPWSGIAEPIKCSGVETWLLGVCPESRRPYLP